MAANNHPMSSAKDTTTATRRASGPLCGRVEQLLVATKAGAPMQSREAVELAGGKGVVGDRYAGRRGHWSDPKWPDQELTLVESEVALTLGIEPMQLRRNIVTSGVDLGALIGRRFRVGAGGAMVEGVRRCDPCAYIEGFSRAGMLKELAGGRGGLRARIIRGGWVHAGDEIEVLEERAT